MNNSVVLIFSGVVVDLCGRHTVAKSFPCLLSFATKANTGSVLTMTGNPQTILIVALPNIDVARPAEFNSGGSTTWPTEQKLNITKIKEEHLSLYLSC